MISPCIEFTARLMPDIANGLIRCCFVCFCLIMSFIIIHNLNVRITLGLVAFVLISDNTITLVCR